MKVIQTDNQIELKSSGLGQALFGAILLVVGIVMAVALHGSTGDGGKPTPIWVTLMGVAFAIIGILVAVFAKNRSVLIQKGANTTVTAKRLLGGSPQQQSVPTANIVAVRLSTYIDNAGNTGSMNRAGGISSGDPNNSRRSVLSLILNNNDIIEAGSSGSNSGFSVNGLNISSLIMKAPLSKEANQVASFLGVPLQADDTSSIAGAVQSVKTTFQHDSPAMPTATPAVTAPGTAAAPPAQASSFAPTAPTPAAPTPAAPSTTPATPPAPVAPPAGNMATPEAQAQQSSPATPPPPPDNPQQ
jgi:hypothetical protein